MLLLLLLCFTEDVPTLLQLYQQSHPWKDDCWSRPCGTCDRLTGFSLGGQNLRLLDVATGGLGWKHMATAAVAVGRVNFGIGAKTMVKCLMVYESKQSGPR